MKDAIKRTESFKETRGETIPLNYIQPLRSRDVAVPEGAPTLVKFAKEVTKPIRQKGILGVLERAAKDPNFIAQLTYDGSRALRAYDLTMEAKAALLSGDVQWIEKQVGKLDGRLRTWLDCRLQQEIW
jgi:hypothetical protein